MDETNPYAPPAAELEAPAADAPALPPFFVVSPVKLVVLSLATFGYYILYWHYRQWKAIGAVTQTKLWPFVRALFFPLTGFDLYPKIEVAAQEAGLRLRGPAWLLALGAVLVNITSWIAGLFPKELPILQIVWVLSIVPPFLAQFAIQDLHARVAPEASPNGRFTVWNWLWIALGLFFWAVLALSFVPASHPR